MRREVDGMAKLLRAQQLQLEQQARQLDTMQQSMAAEPLRDRSASVQGLPAAYSTFSSTSNSLYPESDCGGCQKCESCTGVASACEEEPWVDLGGQYRVMYNASNFGWHPATLDNNQTSQTFFNQRFRTWLTIRPNDHVEGYLQAEMGHIGWGSNFDFPKTYNGPRFPGSADPNGDRVGIELRYGYLGYKSDSVGKLRVGIQPWQDSFGQTLFSSDWDFSVGGISWIRTFPSFGCMDMKLGLFALEEGNSQLADDAVLVSMDLDWVRRADQSVGFSAYYLADSGTYSYPTAAAYNSAWDVWTGLRATTSVCGLPINAFALYNSGQRRELGGVPTFSHDGAALKFEISPLPIGPGAASFQALYSSTGFRTVAQSDRDNFGSQGYWSYLVITSPHGPSDVNDLGVGLQNRGLGLFTLQAKYDYPILNRLSGRLAVGWLRSDVRNPVSGATEMGTELANIFALDFGGGLMLEFGASVLFTGDFYKTAPGAARPDDLYEAFTRFQLEF